MNETDLEKYARRAAKITVHLLKNGPGNKDISRENDDEEKIKENNNKVYLNLYKIALVSEPYKSEFTLENICTRAAKAVALKTGSCDEHAFIAFSYLLRKKVPNVSVCQSGGGFDHTFVVIESNIPNKVIICDAWAGLCLRANIKKHKIIKGEIPYKLSGVVRFETDCIWKSGAISSNQTFDYYKKLYSQFNATDVRYTLSDSKLSSMIKYDKKSVIKAAAEIEVAIEEAINKSKAKKVLSKKEIKSLVEQVDSFEDYKLYSGDEEKEKEYKIQFKQTLINEIENNEISIEKKLLLQNSYPVPLHLYSYDVDYDEALSNCSIPSKEFIEQMLELHNLTKNETQNILLNKKKKRKKGL